SESYRLNKYLLKKKFDFVFVARTAAKDKTYKEIEDSMKKLFKKAGLVDNEKNANTSNKIL
ncbi:MAG: ribonuclease P protein component, partial [Bacillota bacterium]|nr:ribonuclease P protein component [Bacillota bacterium]